MLDWFERVTSRSIFVDVLKKVGLLKSALRKSGFGLFSPVLQSFGACRACNGVSGLNLSAVFSADRVKKHQRMNQQACKGISS